MTMQLMAPSRMATIGRSEALAPGRKKVGAVRQRLLLGAGVATLCFGTVAALASATPIYTGWSAPVNLGPVVNSAASENGPALSADGLSLYFGANNDIWVSQRATTSAAWGAPANVAPVNTTAVDGLPSLSSDGHWMFLSSSRTGTIGGPDLYQSYRPDIHDDFGWQTPTNLGPNVNTAAAENGNGNFDNAGQLQVFFGSDRQGPAGVADIYMTNKQADGTWGPAALVPELNSSGTDNRPNLRSDGLEIFFYSDRTGSLGGNDLYTSTRATVTAPWSTPVDLGATVNSTASDVHPSLFSDGRTLIFSSARLGGFGLSDLYMTTRDQIFPTTKADCKDGGFERFGIFKNQGDCVSYVATGGENKPAG